MTIQEASEQYHIPIEILDEYRSWGLCGVTKSIMADWKYNDEDLERLSLMMTLHDIGFTVEEVEQYLRLLLAGDATESARLQMLNQKRKAALDDIHFHEKQIARMDYLRYKMKEFHQSNPCGGIRK